jgi:RNA polymerase sigma-70 factor (ECF subfamily)
LNRGKEFGSLNSLEFPDTHWSLLVRASLNGEPEAQEALDRFCRSYRPAVLEFIRWCGIPAQDAEEMAQDFFLRLLSSRAWRRAEQSQGRFRTFLLGALKHHLADARRRREAGKRGGGAVPHSLDELMETESEPALELPADAESVFDRDWAVQLVENALGNVATEAQSQGHADRFGALVPFLPIGMEPPSYDALAARLNLTVGAAKSEVHRLRQRFRMALRAEIARTVGAPHEIDEEMRHLHAVLGFPGFDSRVRGETLPA